MANPLYSSAAEVMPVQPTTRFFDPGESLGIMQRYGMSSANRAFAEDALKSANEIDKAANFDPINRRNELEQHEWNRKIKDRQDQEYEEKKTFETTLGTFLVDMAKLDETADDFDEKAAALLADPAAANHDAVKAVYNLKVGQREQVLRERAVKAEKENTLEWKLATEAGVDPTSLYDEDGELDIGKTAEAIRALQDRKIQAEAGKEHLETLQKAVNPRNSYLLDATPERLEAAETGFKTGLIAAAKRQNLPVADTAAIDDALGKEPSKAAFVAQILDLGNKQTDGTPNSADRVIKIINGEEKVDDATKKLVDAAEDVWDVRFAKRQRAGKPTAATTPNRHPTNDRYFRPRN